MQSSEVKKPNEFGAESCIKLSLLRVMWKNSIWDVEQAEKRPILPFHT